MIKVLHIVTAFPRNDAEDDMTPWMISTLQGLEKIGVQNTVLAPSYKGLGDQTVMGIDVRRFRYFPRFWEDLTHDETTPVRLGHKPWYIIHVPFLLLCGRYVVKGLIKHEKFDIVHIHWPLPMAFVGAPAFGRIRTILHFYTAETAMARRFPIAKKFLRGVMKKADDGIAISSHAVNLAKSAYDRPMKVVPYGSFFPDIAPKIIYPSEDCPKRILFVGRLVERKGVKYLIQAMPKVLEKMNATLTIVGGGVLLEELKQFSHEMDMTEYVTFTGIISAEEKAKYYRECDLFVLPACFDKHGDTEGLGVVLLEALSAGKPVIASSVGGIVDIVKHERSGLLVPEKEPEALAKAIIRILSDRKIYIELAEKGYNYAVSNFSVKAVCKRIKDIYSELVQMHGD